MRTTKRNIIELDEGELIEVRHGKKMIVIRAEMNDIEPMLHIDTETAISIHDNDFYEAVVTIERHDGEVPKFPLTINL